ncbi:hypothetical protein OK348_14565 [Flavobacterium sp. MXW15]|uniref:Uncharacterized protein n=1 Tax=Xanthomonas chitinilytica TaxID=2989819 RepID=A0ABT3JYN4_9XANT|nr:hypothetical protein [Xanthomonas sp. H13-6]MCW4456012.1 hypothetical protein [Flavobacterium sp. MXW15]MCW4473610.1 hypothetical protein [Xanthomonas sp. H13-6]
MSAEYQIPGRVPDPLDREAVSRYWRGRFASEPYYSAGARFEDYEPAYYAGHEARIREFGRAYEQVEKELQERWERERGERSPAWAQVREAMKRAWEEAGRIGPDAPRGM